ncbi:MAG: GNAT family N-acetyltransferase [Longimicrobiales bacterium]
MADSLVTAEGEIPAPDEYCELRKASGLSPMSVQAAERGLPNSLYSVTVRNAGNLVGMGRVVGDGLHVQVVDIAVLPAFQGRGISRIIMETVMAYIDREVPTCAVVSLLADIDWLYHKFGFRESTRSTGMVYRRKN